MFCKARVKKRVLRNLCPSLKIWLRHKNKKNLFLRVTSYITLFSPHDRKWQKKMLYGFWGVCERFLPLEEERQVVWIENGCCDVARGRGRQNARPSPPLEVLLFKGCLHSGCRVPVAALKLWTTYSGAGDGGTVAGKTRKKTRFFNSTRDLAQNTTILLWKLVFAQLWQRWRLLIRLFSFSSFDFPKWHHRWAREGGRGAFLQNTVPLKIIFCSPQ